MRKKRFLLNTVSSLGYQVATIVCGLILPNLILQAYGTEVNGLVSSIAQFLRVVSLSEFGMTAVIQSSLYEPLAKKNNQKISEILTSSDRFFRKVAGGLFCYAVLLCIFYPRFVDSGFDYSYVATLIAILAFNSFAQYLFAFTNSQLLSADQRAYVTSFSDIIATVGNTILCAIEIYLGFGIHAVKLTTAIVYLVKPVVTAIYIKRNYQINRHTKYDIEPIKQKWNGVAQHFAYYIFTSTDVLVLTIFSTLSNVSIYSIYVLVLNGLKSVSALFEQGMRSLLGEMWATKEKEKFSFFFEVYEWLISAMSFLIFGCAASLIVPFVQVYTRNVHDADYTVPIFAMLITLAYLIQNIRSPYHTLIQSVGHYKETQTSYIVAAILNIVISIIMVYRFGLVGVAIGTLIAGLVETIWQVFYLYKNVLNKGIFGFVKLNTVYAVGFFVAVVICQFISLQSLTYFSWIKLAIIDLLIWAAVIAAISFIVYRKRIQILIELIRR